LVDALRARGDDVVVTSLRNIDAAAQACARADVVVNLAGAPVARRWTNAQKSKIRRSRVELTRALLERIAGFDKKPVAFVCASAVGYYGTSLTETFVETSSPGADFLAHVCLDWEREANRASEFGMRVAIVRTGLVLGPDGGALPMMLPAFRFGLGGKLASGAQWMSWIHIEDLIDTYLHAIDGTDGAINATAPEPVTNAEFTRTLGDVLRRPTVLPVPDVVLKTLFGEGATILIEGQRVMPERTLASGYRFRYPELEPALRSLLR
jgi:uncharacterized protein (TIGR01777 family)